VRGAERGDSKLVLVGDTRQLPEIEAGGALRSLAQRLGAAELQHIRRQQEPWDREAIQAFHRGDHDRWLGAQIEHGRVTVSATAPQAQRAVVDGWFADTKQHGIDATIMLADRRETVRELNRLARDRLLETGRLGPRELSVAGRGFAEGERVLAMRNHRGLGLRNGDRATVVEVSDDRTLTVRLDRDDRRDLRIPTDYLEAGHLDHGYAATVHKTQGATLDTVHYLGSDRSSQEAALVAGSRHRHDFRLYVVDADLPGPTSPDRGDDARWRRELGRRLSVSRAKELALEVQARARELRHRPSRELHDDANELRPQLAPYPPEGRRAADARSRTNDLQSHVDQARDRAAASHDPNDQRAARRLTELAAARETETRRLEALDQTWAQRHEPALREFAARGAELERRTIDADTKRAILARHDPDLHHALQDQLGPRPAGLADREAWETAATHELAPSPEPDLPDTHHDIGPDIDIA